MRKFVFGGVAVFLLLVFGVFWWGTADDRNDPLNQSDAFVYHDKGILSWLEVKRHNGKIEGKFYMHCVKEEIGQVPVMEKKTYRLTGKVIDNIYEFKGESGRESISFNAWFSGGSLLLKLHGNQQNQLYQAVEKEELSNYKNTIQDELDNANYHAEEKENTRLRNFFTELRSTYGYLSNSEDGEFQLFIKIDEALLQGELSGSLLMLTKTGNKGISYTETRYILNGITDGLMIELFTKVDDKETKLEGKFYQNAATFDLNLWLTGEKLIFHAVTEEEYKRSSDEFRMASLPKLE